MLQAKRGSHIVITTIMFNFIASALMVYLLTGLLQKAPISGPARATLRKAAILPKLGWLFEPLGFDMGSSPLNITFLLALVMACSCLGADLAHQAGLRNADARHLATRGQLCGDESKRASSSSP